MTRAAPLRALLLALGLAACGDGGGVVGSRALNRCDTDDACREGVCDLTSHRCVAVARTEVFFRVVPPETVAGLSDALPTLTPPRSLRTGAVVDLALRTRRTVYGIVAAQRESDATGAPDLLAATVRFTPADGPDVMSPVEVVSQAQPLPGLGNDVAPHTWAAALTDGTYDVLVRPAQALRGTVPPRFERDFDVRSDRVLQRFDIVYPASYTRWSGTLRTRAGAVAGGLSVRVVDPARNNVEVSTVSLTGAADGDAPGAFSVAMAPGAPQEWSLRVTSNVNAHAGLVVELPKAVCARLDPTGRDVAVELPTDLGLPVSAATLPAGPPTDPSPRCTGCVRVSGTVEAAALNGPRRGLRGATVTLHTNIPMTGSALGDGARAWFEDRVQTDADGTFSTWLVPGTYRVVIEPADEAFANTVQSYLVGADSRTQSGQVFVVPPRNAVAGRVLTVNGAPLGNARVQAVPFHAAYSAHPCLAELNMRAVAASANPDDDTTAADGSYHLELDPGLYRVVVEPPAGAGFATTLAQTLCVQSNISAVDVVMDSPVEVHGVVRDPRGVAAPGARVEAVVRVREVGAEGVSLRVARTVAGPGGAYSLLLPADTATSR